MTTRRHTRRPHRTGYTLFEILVVLALLLLLAIVILPSVVSFRGDTRQRAAADVIRGELAAARGRAMEEGRPYRVAINQAGTRIRRAPDGPDFATTPAFDHPDPFSTAVDCEFDHVTAEVIADEASPQSPDEWKTVATVQPDGTCREDSAVVVIKEPGNGELRLLVRGLTSSSRVVPKSAATGGAT